MSAPALRRIRVSPTGLAGSTIFLALGVCWLGLTRPPGPYPAYLAWFLLLAGVGAFIPGAANQVSLLRAYLGAPAFGYAVVPGLLGPLAVAVTLAGLSDLADGVIARRFERPTALGGGLDPVVDGIFYGGVAIGLAFGAAYPAWLAAVVVGRYLLPAAVGGVLLLLGWQPELRHTFFGQLCTTVIALLLGGVALFRGLGQDTGTLVTAAMLLIPATTLLAFADLARSVLRGRRSEGDVRPPPSPPTEGEVNS